MVVRTRTARRSRVVVFLTRSIDKAFAKSAAEESGFGLLLRAGTALTLVHVLADRHVPFNTTCLPVMISSTASSWAG